MGRKFVERKLGVGYIRVSKVGDRGDTLVSPELQRHAIETWAASNGVTIVKWVVELDRSGRSFTRRKVAEIVAEIDNGDYTYIVLWKWSRWGRNMRESQLYLGQASVVGGEVRAATEDFDPNTTMGRFTRDQMLLVAQLQSDMMSDGWKEVHDRRRRMGLPHAGVRRFGYLNTKVRYWPDPDLGPVLASMYERYVAGVSSRRMAVELNTAGIRTSRGNLWDGTAVVGMLDTGFGAGLIREHAKPMSADHPKRDTRRSIDSYDVWRQGDHQAVIPLSLWEKYKKKRLQVAAMPARLRTAAHALSGVMKCGQSGCAGAMVVRWGPPLKSSPGRAKNWCCNVAYRKRIHAPNFISDVQAQAEILAWLVANGREPADVTAEARRIEKAREIKGEVEAAEREVGRLKGKRSRLIDLYSEGDIERGEYRAKRAEVDGLIEAAELEVAGAQERLELNGPDQVRAFGALAVEWDRMDDQTKRDALLSVAHYFVVKPLSTPRKPEKGRLSAVERWRKRDG
jgi:site-specific DNA recombinase